MRVFLSPPFMNGNEVELMADVFASNYIAPCGPTVDLFEREVAEKMGFEKALATTGATSALQLIFRHLGITTGDTVICSDLTFIASIAPAVQMGAMPVFVDCDLTSWTMDVDLLRSALQKYPATKAVVAVDLYGQCCDYDALEGLCHEFGVPLILDTAESLGAKYKGRLSGTSGYASVLSFNGNKIITSGGGGMLLSSDSNLMDDARNLSMQARDAFPWYEHSRTGYNCRMSNVVAAVGLAQFRHLQDAVADKRRVFSNWEKRLEPINGISLMPEPEWSESTRWLTVATLPFEPLPLITELLQKHEIESRPLWKPMHLQPVFRDAPCFGGRNSEKLFKTGICLPSGRNLSEEFQDEILEEIKRFI